VRGASAPRARARSGIGKFRTAGCSSRRSGIRLHPPLIADRLRPGRAAMRAWLGRARMRRAVRQVVQSAVAGFRVLPGGSVNCRTPHLAVLIFTGQPHTIAPETRIRRPHARAGVARIGHRRLLRDAAVSRNRDVAEAVGVAGCIPDPSAPLWCRRCRRGKVETSQPFPCDALKSGPKPRESWGCDVVTSSAGRYRGNASSKLRR
jgi:hypothetical protein